MYVLSPVTCVCINDFIIALVCRKCMTSATKQQSVTELTYYWFHSRALFRGKDMADSRQNCSRCCLLCIKDKQAFIIKFPTIVQNVLLFISIHPFFFYYPHFLFLITSFLIGLFYTLSLQLSFSLIFLSCHLFAFILFHRLFYFY